MIGNETAIRNAYRAVALVRRSERARLAILLQSTGPVRLERMSVKVSGATISVHFDAGTLQESLQVEEPPSQQCGGDADDDQKQRECGAIAILAAGKCPPIDIKREDGRVVKGATFGEQENVFKAHQQR